MKVATTLVGSFPLDYSRENIARALKDQVDIGITYPVLPQLRDFVYMYIEPLVKKGVVVREGLGYRLRGDVSSVEPETPEDMSYAADVAEDLGARYRLAFTGPFTVASRITPEGGRIGDIRTSLLADREGFQAVLEYVVETAREVASTLNPFIVCVDEPVLSVIVGSKSVMFGYTAEEITRALDSVLARFRSPMRGVHVCSRLPPLLKTVLLKLSNANFLDHEHSDIPENRAYYQASELRESGKVLGYGVVSSRNTSVERLEDVVALARDALERYGESLAFIKPDCGFGGMKGYLQGREYEEIVLKKLRVLVEASRGLEEG